MGSTLFSRNSSHFPAIRGKMNTPFMTSLKLNFLENAMLLAFKAIVYLCNCCRNCNTLYLVLMLMYYYYLYSP